MHDLSPTAQTILLVFLCFVIAINLSLLFAIRNRAKTAPNRKKERPLMPWESKTDPQAEELARRVANLLKEDTDPDTKESPDQTPRP